MTGQQRIYVDFSVRSLNGRVYRARLKDFVERPALGSTFIGTDLDEFEVECRVLAADYASGVLYHRPVDATQVPGTIEPAMSGHREQPPAVDVSRVREPELIRT